MDGHDPRCRYEVDMLGPVDWCDCVLIAEVRAEYEGDREAWEETMRRYVNGVLADLRAKVAVMCDEAGRNEHASDLANYETATFEYRAEREVLDKVLALIDGSNDGQG